MIIKKLKLKDWCQHEDLDIDFSPRSNGIMGKNGAGKTNAIRAIRIALTGRTDKDSTLEDEIRDGCTSTKIEVHFEHKGVDGVLKRSFYRSGSSRASIQYGDIDVSGVRDVNNQVYALLGASNDMIEKFSFVEQDALRDILFDTPAKRLEQLISMIPKVAYSKLYRSRVDTFLKTIPEISLPYDEEHVRSKIDEYTETGKRLGCEYASAMEKINSLGDGQRFRKVLDDHAAYLQFEQDAAARSGRIQEETNRLASEKQNLQKLVDNPVEVPDVDFDRVRELVEKHRGFNFKVFEEKTDLSNLITDSLPQSQTWYDTVYEQYQQAKEEEVRLKELRTIAYSEHKAAEESFTRWDGIKEDKSVCPLCNTELSEHELSSYKEADALKVKETRDALSESEQKLSSAEENLRHRQKDLDTAKQILDSWKSANESVRSYFDAVIEPEIDQAQYDQCVHYLSILSEAEIHQNQIQQAKGRIQISEDRLYVLQESIGNNPHPQATEEQLNEAQAKLHEVNKAREDVERLLIQMNTISEELEKFNNMLSEVESCKEEKAAVEEYRTHVELVREMLHRDKIPKLVLLYYLQELRERVGEYMKAFGANIVVNIDDDFNLTFIKNGGVERQLQRLSGGEKTVLSVSLHLATSELFGHEIGLLSLDEPTSNMDSDYLSQFTKIVETLASGILGGDRQLIVITHHVAEMSGVVDKLISIGSVD